MRTILSAALAGAFALALYLAVTAIPAFAGLAHILGGL